MGRGLPCDQALAVILSSVLCKKCILISPDLAYVARELSRLDRKSNCLSVRSRCTIRVDDVQIIEAVRTVIVSKLLRRELGQVSPDASSLNPDRCALFITACVSSGNIVGKVDKIVVVVKRTSSLAVNLIENLAHIVHVLARFRYF